MGRFGVTEILILLGIALLLFGGSRIANIGKGLGEGIKNFKKGIKEGDDESPKLTEGEADKARREATTPAPAEKLAESEKST
mgnify:CR=1 FL=1